MTTPKRLYKYRRVDNRTKEIILDHRIYFSAPSTFNDPFDCQMPLDFTSTPAEFNAYLDLMERNRALTRNE